jgi:hypothetical protein
MVVDPLEQIVRLRRRELEAEAAAYRAARRHVARGRPSPVLRLYARLWWASRPRAAAWIPGLLEPTR